MSIHIYYSTVTSIYHIRKKEHAKYPSVYTVDCRITPWYPGLKTHSRRIINMLCDDLTDNTCGYLTRCCHFFWAPARLEKTVIRNSEEIRAYKPSNKEASFAKTYGPLSSTEPLGPINRLEFYNKLDVSYAKRLFTIHGNIHFQN